MPSSTKQTSVTNHRGWIAILFLIAAMVSGIAFALVWWSEQPLRDIEERLAKGDAAGSLAIADTYLATHSGHSHARALRARALVALGRVAEAISVFEQVGAASPADLRAWSTALLQTGQWSGALPVLERLLQIESNNPETLEAITVCQFELGRQPEAVASAKKLASVPGYEAVGELQLALMYRDWGHATIANGHFQKVLEHRPDATGLEMAPADLFYVFGDSLLQSGDARRAIDMLARSGKQHAAKPVLFKQAEAWQLVGNYEKARQLLEAFTQENPDNLKAQERLAELALQQNDPAAAMRYLQRLMNQPSLTSQTAFLLRRAYTSLGEDLLAEEWEVKQAVLRRKERQMTALQEELRKDPQSARSRLIVAYQSADAENWEAAARSLAILLRQSPDWYANDFVQQLTDAIQQRGQLPPIESLPSQ